MEHRGQRLADHLLVLYLWDAVPTELMDLFWRRAPARFRRHAIGTLGRELRSPPEKLNEAVRCRGRAYWESRLASAISSSNPEEYREELGAIGQWFVNNAANVDPVWLLDQVDSMMKRGFAPNNPFSLVQWLGAVSESEPDKAVEVLFQLLESKHVNRSTFMTQQEPIRAVLKNGIQSGNAEAIQRAQDVIGIFATFGETSYLDLAIRPH